jgi:serine/threonine protein kinase
MSDHQLARALATSSFASSDQESPLPPSPSEFRLWISLNELEIATNYFSQMNLLRKSAHSAVYKGTLPSDGSAVAVKCVYNTRFWFGKKDLRFVIEALTDISHENVVQFKGFCVTKGGSECFLVYAFVAGGTLEQRLHGNVSQEKFLDWPMRVKIMGDVAKGMYLCILFHFASLIKWKN